MLWLVLNFVIECNYGLRVSMSLDINHQPRRISMKISWTSATGSMNGENRLLVTDEPVKFEKYGLKFKTSFIFITLFKSITVFSGIENFPPNIFEYFPPSIKYSLHGCFLGPLDLHLLVWSELGELWLFDQQEILECSGHGLQSHVGSGP